MTEYEAKMAHFRQLVKECADAGIEKAKRITLSGRYVRFYLHCTKDKKLVLLTREESDKAAPETHEILTGESLPPHLPYENYFMWIYERSTRAPIF